MANKFTQFLLDKNPNMKMDDAELLSSIMSKKEQTEYTKSHDPNN